MSTTERHMLSDQKGLAKRINVDHSKIHTHEIQNTMRKDEKFQKRRVTEDHIQGMGIRSLQTSDQSISLEVRRQLFMLFKSKGEKRHQLEFCTKLNYQHQCGLDITLFLCERSPKIYLLWTLYQETARGCTLAKQGSKQKMRITQDLQN